MVTIGVLALQGDVGEHVRALEESGARALAVRRPGELEAVDGLVIPGGESTTMSKLLLAFGLFDPLKARIERGMPVWGTCAGMILLASSILDGRPDQKSLGAIDMVVRRNAFGRQVDSYEEDLEVKGLADPFHAVFIRAPWVESVGEGVEVLARAGDDPAGPIVAVRSSRALATSFHPEIGGTAGCTGSSSPSCGDLEDRPMRVMGIDPGLTRCGIGVVDVDAARRARLVHVSVARSDKDLATHFRLRTVADAIDEAIRLYEPEVVAIERVFAQDNLQSVTTTMQVMGAAMTCVGRAGLPMAVHTPSEVKSAVTGNGRAGKAQVQAMIARILGLDAPPRPADAADALAIAICHSWRGTGLLGAGDDSSVSVSLSGRLTSKGSMTPAQRAWAEAQAAQRRTGAVDPRLRRG